MAAQDAEWRGVESGFVFAREIACREKTAKHRMPEFPASPPF